MPGYKTEPLNVPVVSGLLPESERNRRVALTSFVPPPEKPQVPKREVICYECGMRSQVPAAALSANCVHCHAHLKMTDVDLKPGAQRLTVRTLGDVTVQPDAVLSQLSVVCNNCTLYGRGSGAYKCSGTLRVSCNNRIEGSVQAKRMLVDKSTDVVLTQGITTDELEVNGRLTGRIIANRSILIRRGGELYGDCYTPSLHVEEGGVHRGQWHDVIPE